MFETPLFTYVASIMLLILSHYIADSTYKTLTRSVSYLSFLCAILLFRYFNLVDDFSLVLGLSLTLISLVISIYTTQYGKALHYPGHLEILMDFFLISIISAYIAPNLLFMIIAWTFGEILGYVLIKLGEEHSIEGSLTSSRGFIFTSTLTYEISVFTLITLSVFFTTAGIGLYKLMEPFTHHLTAISVSAIAIPLLMVGFVTKTANIPLHFWLPSAHTSAPSPASAILSGLMVSLGYYGLYRMVSLVDMQAYGTAISWFFVAIGFLSTVYGGLQALAQRDVKKLLAYSTIATNGFVSVIFGLYVLKPLDITKWILAISIVMHAAYKTTLFCEAGLVEIAYSTRYIHGISGFVKTAPLSTMGGLLAILSLLGVPGTLGFLAKLLAIYNSILMFDVNLAVSVASLLAFLVYIAVSALVALKYAGIYYSDTRSKVEATVLELNKELQVPILTLGLFNALLCLVIVTFTVYSYGYIALIALVTPLPIAIMYLAHTQLKTHGTWWKR